MKWVSKFAILVLCFLSVWLTSCAPDAVTQQPVIVATVYNEGPRLKVRYVLPDPSTQLQFTDRDNQQRSLGWKISDGSFEFDGQTATRTDKEPFQQVVFDLVRDPRFFNRRYVVVDEIGPESWSLFLPAFHVLEQETDVVFKSEDSLVVRIGAHAMELDKTYRLGDQDLMAYFGRSEYVETGKAVIIAGPEIPEWLIEDVRAGVSQTMSVMEAGFETPPVNRPTLYLTTGALENGSTMKGGQLDEAVMTFRYRGIDFSKIDEGLRDRLTNTSAHEATHLWIGGRYKNTRNEDEPWMSEGGTEYLADRARNSSDEIVEEFEQRLNKCLMRIGTQPLDGSQGAVHGRHVYDCGYVLHAAAESATQSKSGSNILDIWKTMISGLSSEDQSYAPTDFLITVEKLGGNEYAAFSAPFLSGTDADRWNALPELASKVGIELELSMGQRTGNSQLLVGHWLMPLLAANCEGSHGFYNNSDAKKLDGNNCKPPFESGLEVVSVEDISLITDPSKALETVTGKCAANDKLVLGLKDGTKLEPVACDLDIPPLPPAFKVTKFPELQTLSAK